VVAHVGLRPSLEEVAGRVVGAVRARQVQRRVALAVDGVHVHVAPPQQYLDRVGRVLRRRHVQGGPALPVPSRALERPEEPATLLLQPERVLRHALDQLVEPDRREVVARVRRQLAEGLPVVAAHVEAAVGLVVAMPESRNRRATHGQNPAFDAALVPGPPSKGRRACCGDGAEWMNWLHCAVPPAGPPKERVVGRRAALRVLTTVRAGRCRLAGWWWRRPVRWSREKENG